MELSKLKGIVPQTVIDQIPMVMEKFQINTTLRLSHFLAQCAQESGQFKFVSENLNYSTQGLLNVFKKYFDASSANAYAKQPERIANRVYANRIGNGSESSGDGWKYRGRGYIQLTGKDNYASFSKQFGIDCVSNPDLIQTNYPLASAAWFFYRNGLNQISDKGATADVVKMVTKRINAGYLGLNDRNRYFSIFYKALNS